MPTNVIGDDRYISIIQTCITAINDKFTYSSNLFDMMAPLTEVREVLQSNHIGLLTQLRDIKDPHMIIGILTQSLKEMKLPCLYEVYKDILNTTIDGDVTLCTNVIRSWIIKLPNNRFELFKALLYILQRLLNCSTEYNEVNLSYVLSPFLCRPVDSAFMSIRHMDELQRIKPVISFIIENYSYIFTNDLKSLPESTSSMIIEQVSPSFNKNKPNLSISIASSSSSSSSSPLIKSNDIPLSPLSRSEKMNGFTNAVSPIILLPIENENDCDTEYMPNTSPPFSKNQHSSPNFQGWEWKMLNSIVLAKIENFILGTDIIYANRNIKPPPPSSSLKSSRQDRNKDRDYKDSNDSKQNKSESNTNMNTKKDNHANNLASTNNNKSNIIGHDNNLTNINRDSHASINDDVHMRDSTEDISWNKNSQLRPGTPATLVDSMVISPKRITTDTNKRANPSSNLKDSNNNSNKISYNNSNNNNNNNNNNNKHIDRKDLVVECKALRAQIFSFEDDWTRKHNQPPKSSERGPMQVVYTRYRDMKRRIRDHAAIDVQRIIRGYLARERIKKKNNNNNNNNDNNNNNFSNNNCFSSNQHNKDRDNLNNMTNLPLPVSTLLSRSMGPRVPIESNDMMDVVNKSSNIGQQLNNNTTNTNNDTTNISSKTASSINQSTEVIYANFRDLLGQKKDLKRRLKKFDEDFQSQNGHAPKKADKEVMRPLYQKYHEVKGNLDEMRKVIEERHGSLPDELNEEKMDISRTNLSSSSNSRSISNSKSRNPPFGDYSSGNESDGSGRIEREEMGIVRSEDKSGKNSGINGGGIYARSSNNISQSSSPFNTSTPLSIVGHKPGSSPVFSHAQGNVRDVDQTGGSNSGGINNGGQDIHTLLEEKKNLHAYLKNYEKDFSRSHGRPVMRHEDIQPVASEYQRYKELKGLLKEMNN